MKGSTNIVILLVITASHQSRIRKVVVSQIQLYMAYNVDIFQLVKGRGFLDLIYQGFSKSCSKIAELELRGKAQRFLGFCDRKKAWDAGHIGNKMLGLAEQYDFHEQSQ